MTVPDERRNGDLEDGMIVGPENVTTLLTTTPHVLRGRNGALINGRVDDDGVSLLRIQ